MGGCFELAPHGERLAARRRTSAPVLERLGGRVPRPSRIRTHEERGRGEGAPVICHCGRIYRTRCSCGVSPAQRAVLDGLARGEQPAPRSYLTIRSLLARGLIVRVGAPVSAGRSIRDRDVLARMGGRYELA